MQRHEMEPPQGEEPGWSRTRWLVAVIACLIGVLIAKLYPMWTG